jgi:hypothetical protein
MRKLRAPVLLKERGKEGFGEGNRGGGKGKKKAADL